MGRRRLLLLDEPILRTDLDTQELFARLIKQIAAEGATILLTDEDVTWASRCCTRVVELEDGRIANTYALKSAGDREVLAPERFMPFKVRAPKKIVSCCMIRAISYTPPAAMAKPTFAPPEKRPSRILPCKNWRAAWQAAASSKRTVPTW